MFGTRRRVCPLVNARARNSRDILQLLRNPLRRTEIAARTVDAACTHTRAEKFARNSRNDEKFRRSYTRSSRRPRGELSHVAELVGETRLVQIMLCLFIRSFVCPDFFEHRHVVVVDRSNEHLQAEAYGNCGLFHYRSRVISSTRDTGKKTCAEVWKFSFCDSSKVQQLDGTIVVERRKVRSP